MSSTHLHGTGRCDACQLTVRAPQTETVGGGRAHAPMFAPTSMCTEPGRACGHGGMCDPACWYIHIFLKVQQSPHWPVWMIAPDTTSSGCTHIGSSAARQESPTVLSLPHLYCVHTHSFFCSGSACTGPGWAVLPSHISAWPSGVSSPSSQGCCARAGRSHSAFECGAGAKSGWDGSNTGAAAASLCVPSSDGSSSSRHQHLMLRACLCRPPPETTALSSSGTPRLHGRRALIGHCWHTATAHCAAVLWTRGHDGTLPPSGADFRFGRFHDVPSSQLSQTGIYFGWLLAPAGMG
jgi:hypothetical protein